MATVNYYVNPTTGNDSWDGTSPTFVSGTTGPKEHISAMIDALPDPIVDDVNINLAGTVGSPAIYLESAGKISLFGLRFLGAGARLTILPGIWNQLNYVGGGDPYGGSGSWDPTDGNKPCVIPCVEMDGVNRPINITGVTIGGIYTSSPGMKIGFGNMLILNYCAVGTFAIGAYVQGGGLMLVNSAFTRNRIGVLAENNAQIFCFGDNYIHDSLRYGFVVRWRSTLSFGVWWLNS
ncbi:MAG: hypothetical protein IT350_08890, partial [Deltaproteobacteria bacterium]|nr:hypothetical protein [Deltaproteobacteria bacterium]